jgi:ABC-type branched-subunit amino acid transport system substrate-binding protein
LVKRFASFAALLVTMAACGGSAGPPPQTDIGITTDTILLGNTTALSGPASANKTISYAANAYFNYVNGRGGIDGRKITLKILDDAYTATTTANLTHQLVEQDKVFAIYGGLGTQPQASVREYMNTNKVPQIFVFSGATTWSADYGRSRRISSRKTSSPTTRTRRSASCTRTMTTARTI